MTDRVDYRPPTESEQLIIAAVWEGLTRLGEFDVVAVGMGKDIITDRIRGEGVESPSTWTYIFGKPVIETPHDAKSLTLLVEIKIPGAPE